MIKRIAATRLAWSIASLLFFTQVHPQKDCARTSCYSAGEKNECGRSFWADVDYLYWKIQDSPEPVPLVIQGSTNVVLPPVLGAPNSSLVLGGKKINTGWRSGAKVALGGWFDADQCYGAEVNYFILPNTSKKCSVSSNGSPSSSFVSVPYFNVVTSAQDSIAIASPFLSIAGTATLKLTNNMQGAELNALIIIPSCFCRSKFIALAGFRYWRYGEHLTFSTNSPFNPPHVADTYTTKDTFSTKNNFYGGQLGLVWEYDYRCVSLTAKGKISLGAMRESLVIDGDLLTNDYNNFGAVVNYLGGYFALPTNIGEYCQTKFAAIPEVNINAGYQLFDWMRIKLGYTFIYVSDMLWAGEQIDRRINPTQAESYTGAVPPLLLGYPSPKACPKSKGLWVQGLNVGVEFGF